MRLEVLQVIRPERLCLVHTTVLRVPLLQSLGGLPKTPRTTSSGVSSLLPLQVELDVQETMAQKYNKRRRMSSSFSKGDRVQVLPPTSKA